MIAQPNAKQSLNSLVLVQVAFWYLLSGVTCISCRIIRRNKTKGHSRRNRNGILHQSAVIPVSRIGPKRYPQHHRSSCRVAHTNGRSWKPLLILFGARTVVKFVAVALCTAWCIIYCNRFNLLSTILASQYYTRSNTARANSIIRS
jgi:hypothetical protein